MKTTPYELRNGTLIIQHGQAFFLECIPSKSVYSKKNLNGLPDHPSSQFIMAGEQKNEIIDKSIYFTPLNREKDVESSPAASLLTKLGVDMI